MADPDIPVVQAIPVPLAPPVSGDSYSQMGVSTANLGSGMGSAAPDAPTDSSYPPQLQLAQRTEMSDETFEELSAQGYSRGLAEFLMKNKLAFPLSIWIVDNSGSMMTMDGNRIVETGRKDNIRFVQCSRWAEMQQTVIYHAQLAAMLQKPTIFRLLNDPGRLAGPQRFSIAERGEAFVDEDVSVALSTMSNSSPVGVTPLTNHLIEIRAEIVQMLPFLRRDGSKVSIIIATDGLPYDGIQTQDQCRMEFVQAIKALEGLPIWIVIRLFTDEEDVVEFYNDLDSQLELSLEVIDDFSAEAKEIHHHNKWLTYGLPLHRIREMGCSNRLLDLLDEKLLSKDDIHAFVRLLCGERSMRELPDAEADWSAFVNIVTTLISKEKKQWNPVSKRMEPWIDSHRLKKAFGGGFLSWLW